MALIDNTYFKGEIYIPHAKPSITDDVTSVSSEIMDFIREYERECLIKCLGAELFYLLEDNLDPANASGLKLNADIRWDFLINGHTYINKYGKSARWRGLRYKSSPSLDKPDVSLIAYYVYFYFEKNDYVTRSDVGHVKENGKNSYNVSPALKVSNAWNKFVEKVQGSKTSPTVVVNSHGMYGVDYLRGSNHQEVNLYSFINDMNILVPDTYYGFDPHPWKKINTFGI